MLPTSRTGCEACPGRGFFSSIARDFIAPCGISFTVAGAAGYFLPGVEGRMAFAALLCFWLFAGWFAALLVCKDLLRILMEKLK